MANEISINIGSFSLSATNSVSIADINLQVAKSVQEYAMPKSHGSVIPIGTRKSISVKISGAVVGSDYDDLRSKLDSLKSAFESTAEQNLTLDDDRILKVQYRNFAMSYKTLRTFAEFSFDLVASDPFWYAAATVTDDKNTATSGASWTINNPGNAPARVKVQLSRAAGAITACQFENQTTGELFVYGASVAGTKNLIVNNRMDAVDKAVTNDGTDDIKNFSGDFITLNPGNNTMVFTGTAGVRVQTIYRPAYY